MLTSMTHIVSHSALAHFQTFILITEVVQAVSRNDTVLDTQGKLICHPQSSPTHAFYTWKTEGQRAEKPAQSHSELVLLVES